MKKIGVVFNVFTYQELSEKAKDIARQPIKDNMIDNRFYWFKNYESYDLALTYGLKVLRFQYSLSYSQGDGLSFSCDNFLTKEVIEIALEYAKKNKDGLPIFEKFLTLKDNFKVKTIYNNGYYSYAHKNQVIIESLTEETENFLMKHENYLNDILGYSYLTIAKIIESAGYDCYNITEEDIISEIEDLNLKFLEDGKQFNYE